MFIYYVYFMFLDKLAKCKLIVLIKIQSNEKKFSFFLIFKKLALRVAPSKMKYNIMKLRDTLHMDMS